MEYRGRLYSNGLLRLLYDWAFGVGFGLRQQFVEIPMATVFGIPATNTFNGAEHAFPEGVFAYLGIHGHPTEDEFRQGLKVMSAYAKQVQDDSHEDGSDAASTLGIYHLSDDEWLKMAAIVIMQLGVTKPTSWQWQAAYEQLFAS